MGNNHPPHIGIIGTPRTRTASTLQELLEELFKNRQKTFSDNLNTNSYYDSFFDNDLGVLQFNPKKQIPDFVYNGISL